MTIRLRIPIDPSWRAADRVQVYSDFGSGTVDTDRPLLNPARRLFPDDPRDANNGGSIAQNGLCRMALSRRPARRPQGMKKRSPLEASLAGTTRYVFMDVVVPAGYGMWKFAAEAADGAGNPQGGLNEFQQFVSGEDPPPLSSFAFDSYDDVNDVVSFSFSL
jgi:hypothetical protein